jgi:hypothetical protein
MVSCDALAAENKVRNLKRRLTASDRLRFDIAFGVSHEVFGASNEMYSWVGDGHFHDRGMFDPVCQGAISTGTFSSFLASLFDEDRASFSYNGDRTIKAVYSWNMDFESRSKTAFFGTDSTNGGADRQRWYIPRRPEDTRSGSPHCIRNQVFTLPPDLRSELDFTEPINTATAAGGDTRRNHSTFLVAKRRLIPQGDSQGDSASSEPTEDAVHF